MTANLRAKPNQKAAMQAYSRLGAKLFDELSQLNSKLIHADAYLTAFARSGTHDKIGMPNYAKYDQTWGIMPVVGLGGDELQLPPVRLNSGLFPPIEGISHEQKRAVKIMNASAYVYRLKTAMRFNDKI